MKNKQSRFQPQNIHWYEDLPERGAPQGDEPDIRDDFIANDDVALELSRTSSLLRGPLLAICIFSVAAISIGLLPSILSDFFNDFRKDAFGSTLVLIAMVASCPLYFLLFRIELTMPLDTPVRFNRRLGKVFIYHYGHTWNPFGRWPATIKEFDWDSVNAELTRQAGFSGKAYIVRYALFLVSCKPGTSEVVDRIQLKGNVVTTAGLRSTWAYCRHFMEHGRAGLPAYPAPRRDANFWHSLFFYMPWFDPTEEGRDFRRDLPAIGWFVAAIATPMFWMLLPYGLCHYLVMRVAPQPKWPPEIDARSRSAHAGGTGEPIWPE